MAEPVLYMRGPFPFGPFEVSADLVRDAKLLLKLEIAALGEIASALDQFSGFLDQESLLAVIQGVLRDEQVAQQLATFLVQMHRLLRHDRRKLEDVIAEIRAWQQGEENARLELLSASELDQLSERLSLIVKLYPGLARLEKANGVAGTIGFELETFQLICDLRPVFDRDRSQVEGYIPVTFMRLVYTGADGLPVALDIRLTAKDLATIAERTEQAKRKLNVLREEVQRLGRAIPNIAMTREEDTRAKA